MAVVAFVVAVVTPIALVAAIDDVVLFIIYIMCLCIIYNISDTMFLKSNGECLKAYPIFGMNLHILLFLSQK